MTSGKFKRLSEPQRKVLESLEARRSATYHLYGRSEHGGFTKTWHSLRLAGAVQDNPRTITAIGREMLKQYREERNAKG